MNTLTVVPTMMGNIENSCLGITLPHEHIIHQININSHNPDNLFADTDLLAEELGFFRQAGGATICDVTPIDMGRNPKALQEVSRKSGVNIVSGLGLYHFEVWPDWLKQMSRVELLNFLIQESGGESTGLSAGFIGEVASHNESGHADWRKYRLWDKEQEIFETVAEVQRYNGLFISTHASLGRPGVAQLRHIVHSGADPQRVVIGHCDRQMHEEIELDLEYYHTLLNEGAWLEFDLFGWTELLPDVKRFERIAVLVAEGFSNRLLLSTDTCRLSQLHRYGGRGFDYLFTDILPGLRAAGVSEKENYQMTVTNPARILTRIK